MEILFELLALVQIAAGLFLLWRGMQWLAYVRQRLRTDPGFYAPRTAVLCPCRGMEPGLERNLVALCEFNHQNYEVFFILASEQDAAYLTVKRVAASSRVKATVIIAGKPANCSEKVNNLRVCIEQLPPEFEVLVFADSDGRPGKAWLHHMVAPLNDSRIGATTTMRWFIPNNNSLPTALLAAWNASVVTMLGGQAKNFCWGGGTAIRRSVFDQAAVLEEWQHSVSDDYSMTAALRRHNLPILFLPECLTASYVETDFPSLVEFTNRQILITRVYSPQMWLFAGLTHLLFCATILLGLAVTLLSFFTGHPTMQFAALTFLPLLLGALRGAIRVLAVQEILEPLKAQVQNQAWVHLTLGTAIPFLYALNFIASLLTRTVRWRGISYELISPQQTRIVPR